MLRHTGLASKACSGQSSRVSVRSANTHMPVDTRLHLPLADWCALRRCTWSREGCQPQSSTTRCCRYLRCGTGGLSIHLTSSKNLSLSSKAGYYTPLSSISLLWLSLSCRYISLYTLTLTHSHTLTITCTCCYDEIKGTQDLKIYSHADSLILSPAPRVLCV